MKKRFLSLLLTLVMILGMITVTTLTANAAQYTAVGVSVQSDGVVCDDGWYYLDDPSLYLLYSDNGSTFASSASPLYTDEECLDYLTNAPVLGEKYYFQVFAYAYSDTDYSVTNSKSSIDVEGFCSGRVEDAYKDGAVYIVTCSIIYGELTGGVKAVASGVAYDSAEGGYAPNFTTLKAVSTEGKELEYTMVDGKYSCYEAKSGCLYKTNKGTSFSDMLTTEPQAGETYYSYFLLDSIDGNLNIEEELVDIRIPGYEVEYIASYERDMGFTSLVVYSVTIAPDVYVGGVGMYDGDYLGVGATATQTIKPSGGFAYYKDGKLILKNYSYEGKGYKNSSGYYAVIYSENDLTLELIGNNTLTQTDYYSDMIYVDGANLTVGGDGILTGTSGGYALYAKDITINGGTVEVSTYYTSILSHGEVIINGGDITVESENRAGIYSYYDVTVNGGNVTAIGGNIAIDYGSNCSLIVAEDLKIQASTTVDGTLGEYVAANHDSYKKIVIKTPDVYVGGVGMGDGDYLAVGATKTQTTKPSGGYAYYKNGKLTLNNYSYEGKGYLYNSSKVYYAVIYSKIDLTLELIGNNTLTQTYSDSDTIYVSGASLIVGGTGSLTNTDDGYGIYADQDITINSGTIHSTGYYAGIRSENGSVVINGGDVTAIGNSAINAQVKFEANGGTITATCHPWSSYDVIDIQEGSVIFGSNMTVKASTTVDGELGDYVAENHGTYKKIVITSKSGLAITKQPTNVTVANGEKAATTVTATGEGLTYTWYYTSNGKTAEFYKSSVTGATYSTTMDATRDGRKVYCVITDKYNNVVITDIVTLSMKSGLAITKQPTNVTVANGEKAATTVTATGEGLKYTWYYTSNKAGVEFFVSSVTGATYTTTMDSTRDGRKVYCVITDKYGNTVKTNTVTLTMKSGLAITKQPTNVTVANGEKAATTVTATGEGLKYTWYYTSNKAGVEFFVSSVTGATYSTTMDSTRDGRKVYCVITDKYGNSVTTNTVTLSMKSGLAITKQPTNVTVANGEKAATTVTATGEGLKYTWYYTSNKAGVEFFVSSVTGATYSTTMDATRDGRKVYCVITDKYGNTVKTNTVTLSMKSGLAITKQPTSVTVANGSKAATTVTATGEGLTYTWYYTLNKNGVEFYKSSVTGATYSTTMDATRDGRKVYCVITDKYGNTVKTNTVTLSMKSGLAITKQPTNVTVANGSKAATTVTATGEGLTYTWYYTSNGKTTEFYKSSVTGTTYSTTMDSTRDGRKVYCVITDKYGNTVKTNTVTLSMK